MNEKRDRRIKVTGYYTPDDDTAFDATHESGITEETYLNLAEQFIGLEDIEFQAETEED